MADNDLSGRQGHADDMSALVRVGISASRVVVDRPADSTLAFLCQRFGHIEPTVWRERCARGLVLDGNGRALTGSEAVLVGEVLHYFRELPQEPEIPFYETVLYQDEHLLVADKPHFLPVTPSGRFARQTLLTRLRLQTGNMDLVPLHRIDKDTAGLVLFSTNPATRGRYQSLFPARMIEKTYLALAPYRQLPEFYQSRIAEAEDFFRSAEVAGEPNAQTRIALLARVGALALYQLQPITGRKHQLRVQMAALGAPLLNDALYPQLGEQDDYRRPLGLLASELCFRDPLSGARRRFRSQQTLNLLQGFQQTANISDVSAADDGFHVRAL